MEVYKSSDSSETQNNTLTIKNREVNKINKISDRGTKEKEKKSLILVDSVFKSIEGWRLSRRLKFSVYVKNDITQRNNEQREKISGKETESKLNNY